jgi:hypothetical protein
MRTFYPFGVLITAGAVLGIAVESHARITGLERVASGLSGPIFATHAPGDNERLFIVERGSPGGSTNASASIRILNLDTGILEASPFLTITGIDNNGEGGLLGMAFHPDYETNGKFYLYLTAGDSIAETAFSSYVREYTVSANPNVANTEFTPILTFGQPQTNHNAGWIGFSPNNGYLYIPTGDGGGGNDDDAGHTAGTGNAQDFTDNLLGKILRIDVNGDDFPSDDDRNYAIPSDNPYVDEAGDDEIWALGLRNPFRSSFDRLTGDLWLGDVGQGQREEIDRMLADAPGAQNLGWRLREGNIQTPGVGGPEPENYLAPVYDYNRDNDQFGGSVVTGGYVYRGPDPSLDGQYFFLDSRNSPGTADDNYWIFDPDDPFGSVENIDSQLTPDAGTPQFPVSFGEDAEGNLYIVYLVTGDVYRIATSLPGDYNLDGVVDAVDYTVWRNNLDTNFVDADGDGSGTVDAGDYTIWKNNYGNTADNAGAGSGGLSNVPEPCVVLLAGQLLMLGLLGSRSRAKME